MGVEPLVYRVWAAAKRGADLVAQGEHQTLFDALAQARSLATNAIVAIEVTGQCWQTFAETVNETLGPLATTRVRTPSIAPRPAATNADDEEPSRTEGSERRTSPRFTTSGMRGESVSHLDDGTPVRILDVSSDGVQLQLPSRYRMARGRDLSLRIRSKRGAVDVTGRVAWVTRNRCGVHFDWDQTPSFAKTYIKGLIADVESTDRRR